MSCNNSHWLWCHLQWEPGRNFLILTQLPLTKSGEEPFYSLFPIWNQFFSQSYGGVDVPPPTIGLSFFYGFFKNHLESEPLLWLFVYSLDTFSQTLMIGGWLCIRNLICKNSYNTLMWAVVGGQTASDFSALLVPWWGCQISWKFLNVLAFH